MSTFQVVDIPREAKAYRSWRTIAAALLDNKGRALFIPSNGAAAKNFRQNCHQQVTRYLPLGTQVHSAISEGGATLWVQP